VKIISCGEIYFGGEEVHIHGYDITKNLAANETANVSFEASIPGIFEIELEHSGTPLGRLKVEP